MVHEGQIHAIMSAMKPGLLKTIFVPYDKKVVLNYLISLKSKEFYISKDTCNKDSLNAKGNFKPKITSVVIRKDKQEEEKQNQPILISMKQLNARLSS